VLRNRIVFPAHLTNCAEDGLPTAQHTAYYAARAAGGAGLVITEEQGVDPHDRPYEKTVDGTDPRVVPGYRAITAAVHAHGAAVLAQLTHNGGQADGLRHPPSRARAVAGAGPAVPRGARRAGRRRHRPDRRRLRPHGRALRRRRVRRRRGAGRALLAGAQFLSPATNHRTDAHGRDRARFLLEVVEAVRGAIGPDRVLGVRLCGDEGIEHGIGIDDAVATARRLEATGRVDLLNTAIGVATSTLHLVTPSLRVPPGYASSIPAALKAAVACR
jgi:2,4-dienoyl-CoA reductase (NADPH2)